MDGIPHELVGRRGFILGALEGKVRQCLQLLRPKRILLRGSIALICRHTLTHTGKIDFALWGHVWGPLPQSYNPFALLAAFSKIPKSLAFFSAFTLFSSSSRSASLFCFAVTAASLPSTSCSFFSANVS